METIVVTTKLGDNPDLSEIEKVENEAKIRWKLDYGPNGIIGGTIKEDFNEDTVTGNFNISGFEHTVSKKSKINYADKTVEWTVDYKTYNDNIEGLIIEDKLKEKHKYTDDDWKLELNGRELEKASDYTLQIDENNKNFTLTLKENIKGSDKYNHIKLIYKTEFDLSKMEDTTIVSSYFGFYK